MKPKLPEWARVWDRRVKRNKWRTLTNDERVAVQLAWRNKTGVFAR